MTTPTSDPRMVLKQAPGILRAAGLGDRRVAGVTRLKGGSKKGVYRVACDDGFSAILYVWDAAEDYWPAEPGGARTGPFAHASGIGLFEASGRHLEEAGVRIPRTYLLDRSHAVYPADIVLAEDVRGGTLERLLETEPRAAMPVVDRLGGMLAAMRRQRAGRIGKVAETADDATESRCEQIVLDRALRQLAGAADRVPEIAEARRRLDDTLHALAAAVRPRAEYTLIHGELGPDHVLIDGQGQPVVIDIEGAMYFDVEWEHVFLRLRFGRHYERLMIDGLDMQRLELYALALDLSLIEGPLRLLDGGYPDRDQMLAIAGWAVERVLALSRRAAAATE
jgi:Phosphotransferase enzyme family